MVIRRRRRNNAIHCSGLKYLSEGCYSDVGNKNGDKRTGKGLTIMHVTQLLEFHKSLVITGPSEAPYNSFDSKWDATTEVNTCCARYQARGSSGEC